MTRQRSTTEMRVDASAEILRWLTAEVAPRLTDRRVPRIAHLERRIDDQRHGPRAQNTDPTSRTVAADPTLLAAMSRDQALADLEALQKAARQLHGCAQVIDRLGQAYLTTTHAEPEHEGEAGCALCARVGRWSPVYVSTDFATVLAEPLAKSLGVCSACHRFVRSRGRVPGNDELAFFHGRGQGRWPKDRTRKAAA